MDKTDFFAYLKTAGDRVLGYLRQSDVARFFQPSIIEQTVWAYPERSAKRLRPAVLMMAAGCMGGAAKEEQAIPAAAGVELFHTWTLVHDDLIDNDSMRRFAPTAHVQAADTALRELPLSPELAAEFGRDVAILAGDVQHGWSVTAFTDCALRSGADPALVLRIIRCLQSYVLGNLIGGETLDVQYGMTHAVETLDLSEDEIEHMLWLKTGVLYEFAGWAGAVIGSGRYVPIEKQDPSSPAEEAILAVRSFTSNCGTAFQLQDDILGIVGNEADLGKPVGSDIREGKQTIIVHEALKKASPVQKEKILSVLGNKEASEEDVSEVAALFDELEGVKRANERALGYIENARQNLPHIPDGPHKELLHFWADFMINRAV